MALLERMGDSKCELSLKIHHHTKSKQYVVEEFNLLFLFMVLSWNAIFYGYNYLALAQANKLRDVHRVK